MQKEQRIDAEPIYLRFNSNTHVAIPLHEYDQLKYKAKYHDAMERRLKTVFPYWIKQQRLFLGLSQIEFAKVTGKSPRTIAYYEIGERFPNDIERFIEEIELCCLIHIEEEIKKKRGVVFGDKLRGPKRG